MEIFSALANLTPESVLRGCSASADIKVIALSSEPSYIADTMYSDPEGTIESIQSTGKLVQANKRPNQIHWGLLALVATESLFTHFYFPKWELPVIATSMPPAFAVICCRKLFRRAGFWILVAAITVLFWMVNARIMSWINRLGVLSIALVGGIEMIAVMAIVVRVYPEAKKR